jgi:hypothetical protein
MPPEKNEKPAVAGGLVKTVPAEFAQDAARPFIP